MQTDRSGPDGPERGDATAAGDDLHIEAVPTRADRQRRASLASTIEGEIVPRLLMACRASSPGPAGDEQASGALEPGDVDELARLLLAHGPGVACDYVEALRQRGAPYDLLCLDLLAPTARRLVALWENQDFSYTTLATSLEGLHAVVLEVSGAARSDRPVSHGG